MSMKSHLWARRTSIYDRNDILALNGSSLCIEKRKARIINLQLMCSSPWLVTSNGVQCLFPPRRGIQEYSKWSLESTGDMQGRFRSGWAETRISKLPY